MRATSRACRGETAPVRDGRRPQMVAQFQTTFAIFRRSDPPLQAAGTPQLGSETRRNREPWRNQTSRCPETPRPWFPGVYMRPARLRSRRRRPKPRQRPPTSIPPTAYPRPANTEQHRVAIWARRPGAAPARVRGLRRAHGLSAHAVSAPAEAIPAHKPAFAASTRAAQQCARTCRANQSAWARPWLALPLRLDPEAAPMAVAAPTRRWPVAVHVTKTGTTTRTTGGRGEPQPRLQIPLLRTGARAHKPQPRLSRARIAAARAHAAAARPDAGLQRHRARHPPAIANAPASGRFRARTVLRNRLFRRRVVTPRRCCTRFERRAQPLPIFSHRYGYIPPSRAPPRARPRARRLDERQHVL